MTSDRDFVAGYARALGRRAVTLVALRATVAAVGTGALSLAAAAALAGPVVTPVRAQTSFALVGLAACLALVLVLRPLARLRREGVHRLLRPVAPELASSLRTALDLQRTPSAFASSELVAAHAASTGRALARVPRARVAGLSWLRHPAVALGLVATLAAVLSFGVERVAEGAHALRHPATVESDGLRVAPIVARVHVALVYPSYLDRPPAETDDLTELAVPRGTSIELSVTSRLPSQRGFLRVGGEQVRLGPKGDELVGGFVAREDAEIEIRVQSDGRWYADPRPRKLRVLEDASPTITLEAPTSDLLVGRDDVVSLRFRAGDDVGLASVDLVAQLAGTPDHRRRLWSPIDAPAPVKTLSDETTLTPSAFGAQDGDLLLVWLEAEDGDAVSGPKRAVSRVVTIEIASGDRSAALRVPELRALLDQGIDLLGGRLQAPVPEAPDAASQRFEALRSPTDAWTDALRAFADGHAGDDEKDRIEAMAERTRRLLAREASLHRPTPARLSERKNADADLVAQHEGDVLALADLLAQALVDEARAITSELARLSEEMRKLLDALREAPNEETRRALLAEIARAERRLMELARAMQRLTTRVPNEFINEEAVEESESPDALQAMRDAVERGDLEAAQSALERLSGDLDRLAKHVDSGGARFREARFGARDAAMGEARRQLSMLADAQEGLAERSSERLDRLSERAGEPAADATRTEALRQKAEAIERELGRIGRGSLDEADSRMLDEAQARARDTTDALRTGDLGEALRNAARTGSSLEPLASGQRAQAEMFPGQDGTTARNAETAGQALDAARDLERQIAGASPDLDALADDGDRRGMRDDARAQQDLRAQTEALERSFEQGPDGQPLSPRAGRSLREATERMRRAEQALERGGAQEGSRAQEEASRELRDIAEQLSGREQSSEAPSRKEGGDGGFVEGPVRIPGADEFEGPAARRRGLLDAMREPSPPGFEKAVGRYYEELLR